MIRLFIIVFIFVAAAAGVAACGWQAYTGPGPLQAGAAVSTTVKIERGMSVRAIAGKLEAAGVVDHPVVFVTAAGLTRAEGPLKAGEYAVPARASVADLLRILRSGRSIQVPVTIPEGLTSAQIVRLLGEHPDLTGEVAEIPPEGSLLPETYHVDRGTKRSELVARMRAAHDAVLAEVWAKRVDGLPYDTAEEAVVLASIVEKETAVAAERPRVAAVFVNRLRKGIRLQSDPTIIYGLTKGEPLGRGLRRSEIDKATAYNTYAIDGLPPTPIANPGRASLEAVARPAVTNELYFVADGSGGHAFATTLAEHTRNVAKWRQIEQARAKGNGKPDG